jgi:hypothetical protein
MAATLVGLPGESFSHGQVTFFGSDSCEQPDRATAAALSNNRQRGRRLVDM